MDKKQQPGDGNASDKNHRAPTRSRVLASAIGEFDAKPQLLADALHGYLGDDGIRTLIGIWNARQ
jgi:ParB family chromosome partitioning protein